MRSLEDPVLFYHYCQTRPMIQVFTFFPIIRYNHTTRLTIGSDMDATQVLTAVPRLSTDKR